MQNKVAFKRDAAAVIMVGDDAFNQDRCADKLVYSVRLNLFRKDGRVDDCAIAVQDEVRPRIVDFVAHRVIDGSFHLDEPISQAIVSVEILSGNGRRRGRFAVRHERDMLAVETYFVSINWNHDPFDAHDIAGVRGD